MPSKSEQKKRLREIKAALEEFPRIIKQDEIRGRAHRALMKAFEPMARDLEKRMKKNASRKKG